MFTKKLTSIITPKYTRALFLGGSIKDQGNDRRSCNSEERASIHCVLVRQQDSTDFFIADIESNNKLSALLFGCALFNDLAKYSTGII